MRLVFLFLVLSCTVHAQDNTLWYTKPTSNWNHALPVGNGRLAAMVFGGTTVERIQLNEETVWAGTRINDLNPGSLANLKQVQQALLNNRHQEAYELARKHMLGTPPRIRSYQTLGDLFIEYDSTAVFSYKRSLDLADALHTVSYKRPTSDISETVFISSPDDILVVHIRSTSPINCRIRLGRTLDALTRAEGNRLVMLGQIYDSTKTELRGPAGPHLRFVGVAEVQAPTGMISAADGAIRVQGATELVIRFTAATDYDLSKLNHNAAISPLDTCNKILNRASKYSYEQLKQRHLAEYRPLFAASKLDLGKDNGLPTDQRLEKLKEGGKDDALIALYYQYGRYLLLGSSRYPAKLPANLQGKWNHHFDAPWDSDYHTNINLQMNYWPADLANVSSTFPALAGFMVSMLSPGRVCARAMYGVEGWAMHHVTDIYGRTSINADPRWGTSPLAGAWMALNLFDHWDFNRDPAYLRKVFPLIKGSADFIMNFLIDDGTGTLVTAPSMSPENEFYIQDTGKARSWLTHAPAIDIQIIRELFANIRSVAKEMNLPAAFVERMNAVENKLPPHRINSYGGIQEWIRDYREVEPGHRHMSHLFGLYPGTSLTRDPQLLQASRRTLEHRLANGGGHTGWSRAWMINFYARLKDSEQAYFHLEQLLKKSTLQNLFDDHPPFQIDGNFGGTAGIAEMLLQSHNGVVELLPATPAAWTGSVRGLKARGGFVVDIVFENGAMVSGRITSRKGTPLKLSYKGKTITPSVEKGKFLSFNSQSFK